jgi:hypothetical protein
VLGRFLSADTIVPSPADPQQFNRYAYTRNNPLKYTDPTGHMMDDGCRTEGCGWNMQMDKDIGNAKRAELSQRYDACHQNFTAGCSAGAEVTKVVLNGIQEVASKINSILNSGVGVQWNLCGGGDSGFGLEGCVSGQMIVNPLSGQVGFFGSVSLTPKLGIPNGGFVSPLFTPNIVVAPGVTDLSLLFGPSEVQGFDVNLDAGARLGYSGQRSASIRPFDSNGDGVADTSLQVNDLATGAPVMTLAAGPQGGVNQIPTGVDGSLKAGGGYTVGCVYGPTGRICRGLP